MDAANGRASAATHAGQRAGGFLIVPGVRSRAECPSRGRRRLSHANELDGLRCEIRLRGPVGCRPGLGVAVATCGRSRPPGLIGARRTGERKPQQRFNVIEGQDDRARVPAFQIGVERRVLLRNTGGVWPRDESEGGGADLRPPPPRAQVAKTPGQTSVAFAT